MHETKRNTFLEVREEKGKVLNVNNSGLEYLFALINLLYPFTFTATLATFYFNN